MSHPRIIEFLTAIIQDRTDRPLLLVFADWLEEQGDYRAADLRELVVIYEQTPTHWKPDYPGTIALTKFMVFGWYSGIWHHYIRRNSCESRIVMFPLEEADYHNAYLDVLRSRYPAPKWC